MRDLGVRGFLFEGLRMMALRIEGLEVGGEGFENEGFEVESFFRPPTTAFEGRQDDGINLLR